MTRKVDAKTVTRNLDAAQAERYRPWSTTPGVFASWSPSSRRVSVQLAIEAEHWGENS